MLRFLAFLAAAASCCGVLAEEPAYPFTFDQVNVAPGIIAFVEKPGHAIVSGNSVAIIGDDAIAVVDTGQHDHVAGNALYAQAYPDARFVAHAFTARMLVQEVAPYMGESCVRFLQRESGGLRFRASDIAFTDEVTLDLGKREVIVRFLGRANTAGDAIVSIPDAKVVLTGDVLVFPFPFATQSYIAEWAQVLRRIEAMDVDAIVPGHGPVMRDKAYLRLIAELKPEGLPRG